MGCCKNRMASRRPWANPQYEMSVQAPLGFSWDDYRCYSAFDSLLESFVLGRMSWLLKMPESIDPVAAIKEIRDLYVEHFDEGEDSFDDKARGQFSNASRNAKLFLNLWKCSKFGNYNKSELRMHPL